MSLDKKNMELLKKELKSRGFKYSAFVDAVVKSAVAGLKEVKKGAVVSFACFILEDTGKKGDDKFEGHVNDGL